MTHTYDEKTDEYTYHIKVKRFGKYGFAVKKLEDCPIYHSRGEEEICEARDGNDKCPANNGMNIKETLVYCKY